MSAQRSRTDELLEMWMRATEQPVPAFQTDQRHPPRRSLRPVVLVGTVAILLVALAVGALLLTGSAPAPAPTPSPPTSSGPPVGFKRFEAPGITFDYPADWTDQTDVINYPARPQIRTVAVLGRGVTVCPEPDPKPTPAPGCATDPTEPGSMILTINEYPDQLPGTPFRFRGTETTIGGYPVWEAPTPDLNQASVFTQWAVQAPDRGVYLVGVNTPPIDAAAHKAEVLALLRTLQLSAWEAPPTVIDGHVHLSLAEGFSFDYPAGWTLYYPSDNSMMDTAIVTVASNPLLPPCAGDSCQRFTIPPDTVAVEFRAGSGPNAPDWSKSTVTLGGQPASDFGAWGPSNATGADVGHSWGARLTDRETLGVYVSIRGPNIPSLQVASDDVLRGLLITPVRSPAP